MAGLLETLQRFGAVRLAVMALVTAALIGFFSYLGSRAMAPSFALLYADLDLRESGQIVTRLEAARVPYKIASNGAQIMVPDDQVLKLRMQLAEAGLPSGGSIGWEIFDRADALGTTNFVQNINHLRALEGELARTIRAIDGVQSARVHLVLPKREVFSRDNRLPSASIVIKGRGRGLDKPQVRAVQNLVAAAVPDLKPSRIAIVDDRGNLLASTENDDAAANAASNLAEIRRQHEERLKKAVETLLERSVGAGNVRTEITADIDFDRITTNSETYDPDGQVIRSTQTISEDAQSSEGQNSQAVTVASNLPENAAGGGQNQNRNQRTEEVVNYEVSRTVKTQTREAGLIRRLSVAVLVNGSETTGADGKKTYQPRSEDELKQLTALVRSTVGFDAKRGDTVEVVSMRFAEGEPVETVEPWNLLGLGKSDLFRIGEIVGMLVLGIIAFLMVVRPLVQWLVSGMAGAGAGGRRALAGGGSGAVALTDQSGNPTAVLAAANTITVERPAFEQMIDVARIEGQVKASSMKKIGEIIDTHPEEAANIVRSWLYQTS